MYQLFLSFSCVQKTESCPGIEQEEERGGGRLLYGLVVTDRLSADDADAQWGSSNAVAKIGRRRKSARVRGHQSRKIAETKSEDWAKGGLLVKEEQRILRDRDLVSQLLLGKDREPGWSTY